MSRPLWQILFAMSFAAFAAARVLVAYTLHEGAVPPLLLSSWGLALLGSALLFVGAMMERPWPVAALTGGIGALLVAATLLEEGGLVPPVGAVAQEAALIALLSVVLALALRLGGRRGAGRARPDRAEASEARRRLEALRRPHP